MYTASNCAIKCIAIEGLVSKFTWKSVFRGLVRSEYLKNYFLIFWKIEDKIVTGDNGFRQKSGILKIQFFIESRCPPPKLSNDIKYLYSPALDICV